VDVYPFILEAVGEAEPGLMQVPGVCSMLWWRRQPERNVLVEYHGMGSTTGAFMIRQAQYKYVFYVNIRRSY